jgi:hypothetical protein
MIIPSLHCDGKDCVKQPGRDRDAPAYTYTVTVTVTVIQLCSFVVLLCVQLFLRFFTHRLCVLCVGVLLLLPHFFQVRDTIRAAYQKGRGTDTRGQKTCVNNLAKTKSLTEVITDRNLS